MDALSVTPIPAFDDNYIWCIHRDQNAVLVDPGYAAPAQRFLRESGFELTAILVTHHHYDHVNGIAELLSEWPTATVIGPATASPAITQAVKDGDTVTLFDHSYQVIAVPGHTLDHLAYYQAETGQLFCGDTLFAGGCGRLFEGSPEQMLRSLQRLQDLPAATRVYCAHEYTLANLAFALKAEPENATLRDRYSVVTEKRERGEITLPSTLAQECASNPFLRTDSPSLRARICEREGSDTLSQVEVFAALRGWKDNS